MLPDLRYATRSLLRQPSFALTAIFTLALGIGATTAIFSVVNAVILRPLPFARPDRIVSLANYRELTGARQLNVSAPDFRDWKARSTSFQALAYYQGGETSVSLNGSADYASVYYVTPGFFESLGARTIAGRLLSDAEQAPGGPLAVVITDAYARKQFNGSSAAVGTTIKFADSIFTVVGVLAPGYRFPSRADIYCTTALRAETASRSGHNYRTVARLRDGVTLEQAQAEMTSIARQLEQEYPDSNKNKLVGVVPLQEIVVGSTRQAMFVLLGAVAMVLLIACANVANLLLARSSVRSREMVVRAAVGASRGRLVRQLLTESLVLGVASAAAGAWLARLGVLALVRLAPPVLPRLDEVTVDLAALVFALLVALGASVVFGLAPALQVSRVHLVDGLRQGGKGSSVGTRTGWARSAFVVAEIALAVVLVVGAGLFARSLAALAAVDMGFDASQLLVLRTTVPIRSFEEAPRATAFYRDVLQELRGLPGVEAVGAVTSLPTAVRSNGGYWLEGGPGPAEAGTRSPQALFTVVTPQYFDALKVPILKGRDFSDGDRRDATLVAIVNESLARAAFPGQEPLGRRIMCGLDSLAFMTIVGVVRDIRTAGPSTPAQPEIYMPYQQHPGPATALNIVARTRTDDPLALAETMRRAIAARNSDVPVRASTMDGTLETASATPRFQTFLLVMFAAVALLLALAGVYGVMACTINQRLPELGVRVALGATPGGILTLTLAQGGWLAGAGLGLGLALSFGLTRAVEGLLFGVTARDPLTLGLVIAVVAAASFVACYIPGRRAARVDPMIALRAE